MRRLAFAVFALLVAGCSGGGGGTSAVPAVTSNAPGGSGSGATTTAGAQVQITIPAPPTLPAARRVQYVSPATQSLSFAPVNGTPIVATLTAGTPGCTVVGGATTCTITMPLPVGPNQQFVVSTFASTDGSGTPLSATRLMQTIISGQANPISLTLGGIPKTVTLAAPTTAIPTVAATSIPVTVTVKDASGNTIIGNAPFSDAGGNPVSIALANSDTSAATKLTPATLTAPGSAMVAYDNYFQPTTTTITASGPGLANATATLTFAPKTIALAYTGTDPLVLIAYSGIESVSPRKHAAASRRRPLFFEDTNAIAALLPTGVATAPYALGAHQTVSPSGFDEFCSCGSDYGMATAANGHVYFTEGTATQFGFFDAGVTPTWPAASTIFAATGTQQYSVLALGPGGKMFAAIEGGFVQFDPVTRAPVGPPITTSAAQYFQVLPHAIAVGPDGTVYIELFAASGSGDEVLAFAPAGNSYQFARAFWTANSNLPADAIFGLYVDAANKMYISADFFGTVDVLPATSTGLVLPSMVYSNDIQLQQGAQVLVDRGGDLIWTTYITASIYAPNSGSVPPPGHDPNVPWGPPVDTPAIQTVTSNSDTISVETFGPGS